MVVTTTDAAGTDDEKEAGLLKKTVEKLEEVNTTLKEKLVEARLEMTALRRTSVERGEAVLDQVTREFIEKGKQQLDVSWSTAPDEICMGLDDDGYDEEGLCQDDGVEAKNQSPDTAVSDSTDNQELTPPIDNVKCNDRDGDPSSREAEEQQVEQDGVGMAAPTDSKEKKVGCRRTSDNSDGDEMKRKTMAAAPTAISFRRLSSSAFKDAEAQAELIEALREQISELRRELQTTRRVSYTSAAGAEIRRRGGTSSLSIYPHDNVVRQPGPRSMCSSDDDSGRDRDDCDDLGIGRVASDDDGNSRGICSSYRQRLVGDEGTVSGGGGVDGERNVGGGDFNSREHGNGNRVDDDRSQSGFLQLRVNELSAELEEGKIAFEALEQRSQQEQSAFLELQRELLRLLGARDNRTVMVAAVAHGSAGTPASSTAPLAGRHYPGGNDGPELGPRNKYTNYNGLCWLKWFWRTVCCGNGIERGLGSGLKDRSYDETKIRGGGNTAVVSGDVGDDDDGFERGDRRGGQGVRRRRFLATERESLLTNKQKNKMALHK